MADKIRAWQWSLLRETVKVMQAGEPDRASGRVSTRHDLSTNGHQLIEYILALLQ